MADTQTKELKEYEKVLQEMLYTEKAFLDKMGFLAGLAPIIKGAIERGEVNQNATPEMKAHQVAMLEFLEAAEALNKNADRVRTLFSQAIALAKKIENGTVTPEEIAAHQQNQAVINGHINNILKMAELSAKYDIVNYFDPEATKLPLNDFIVKKMTEMNRAGKLPTLAADAFQRLPRYKLLTEALIKNLEQENLARIIQPELLLMSLETTEKAAEESNNIVKGAQLEKRIKALEVIIQDKNKNKNKKPTQHQIAVAVSELKNLISDGEPINYLLQKKGVDLAAVVVALNKKQKIRTVNLSSPSEKQNLEVGAQVLANYISSGFRLNFDESVKASKLWKEALTPNPKDNAKPKPIVIDLPEGLLSKSAQVRRAVKTANQLKDVGFEIETTPAFKHAVDKYQKKSYGVFNFRAKLRQSNFKNLGNAFISGVKTSSKAAAEAPLPVEIQKQLDALEIEYQAKKAELLNRQEIDDVDDKPELGVEKNEAQPLRVSKPKEKSARSSLDIELEKARKELKALEAEFKQLHPEMHRKPAAAIYQKIEADKLKSDKPSRHFTPHKVSRAGKSVLFTQQKTEDHLIKKDKKNLNKPSDG